MKLLSGFLLFFVTIVGFQAQATPFYRCSDGPIGSDMYFEIDLMEDGLAFRPYESGFTVDASQASFVGDTYSIVNQTVEMTAEGETFPSLVNALLIFDEPSLTLNLAISYDREAFVSYEMTCVKM